MRPAPVRRSHTANPINFKPSSGPLGEMKLGVCEFPGRIAFVVWNDLDGHLVLPALCADPRWEYKKRAGKTDRLAGVPAQDVLECEQRVIGLRDSGWDQNLMGMAPESDPAARRKAIGGRIG